MPNGPFSEATEGLFADAQGIPSGDDGADLASDAAAAYARGELDKEAADDIMARPDDYIGRFGGQPLDAPLSGMEVTATEDGGHVIRDPQSGYAEHVPFGEGVFEDEQLGQAEEDVQQKLAILNAVAEQGVWDELPPDEQDILSGWADEITQLRETYDGAVGYDPDEAELNAEDPMGRATDVMAEAQEDAHYERQLDELGVPQDDNLRDELSSAFTLIWDNGWAPDGDMPAAMDVLQAILAQEGDEQ
jgi:hypothetical protein